MMTDTRLPPELLSELRRLRRRVIARANAQDRVYGPGRAKRVADAVAHVWRQELATRGLRPKTWRPGYLRSIWRIETIPADIPRPKRSPLTDVDQHGTSSMSHDSASIRLQNPPVTCDTTHSGPMTGECIHIVGRTLSNVTGQLESLFDAEPCDIELGASWSTPTGFSGSRSLIHLTAR